MLKITNLSLQPIIQNFIASLEKFQYLIDRVHLSGVVDPVESNEEGLIISRLSAFLNLVSRANASIHSIHVDFSRGGGHVFLSNQTANNIFPGIYVRCSLVFVMFGTERERERES